MELQNSQSIIILTRRKLLKHLRVLRASSGSNSALLSALDDIEELCDFLDIKIMFPVSQIDKAVEANERLQNAAPTPDLNTHKSKSGNSKNNENPADYNNGKYNDVKLPSTSKVVSDYDCPWINCLDQLNPSLARQKEIELHNIDQNIPINVQYTSQPYLPPIDPLIVQ